MENKMNLEKQELNKSMFQILITSIYSGKISTAVAQVATAKEADEMVDRIEKMRPREFVSHHADRLN
jgi:hypothetical protein